MSHNLRLNPEDVLTNAELRYVRVSQRFPGRNIERHSKELVRLAEQAKKDYRRLASPWYLVRLLSLVLSAAMVVAAAGGVYLFNAYLGDEVQKLNIDEILSVVQLIGWLSVVVVGAIIWRIKNLERNLKRSLIRKRIEALKGYLRVLNALSRDKEAVRVYHWYKRTDDSPNVVDDTQGIYNYLRHSGVLAEIVSDIGELYNDSYSDERVDEYIKSLDRVTDQTARSLHHKQAELAQAMLLEQYGAPRALTMPKAAVAPPEKPSESNTSG